MNGFFARSIVAALLLAVVCGLLSGFGLEREPFSRDESRWMGQACVAWEKLRTGAWDDPYWLEGDLTWGFPNPPIAKYLMGIGLHLSGETWEHKREVPPPNVLRAGRLSSVFIGAFGAAVFFLLVRPVVRTRAAIVATLLLASAPLWLTASRRAMVDIHCVALALAGVALIADGRRRVDRLESPVRLAVVFAAAGTAFGLAVGAKMIAGGLAAGCGALLMADLVRGALHREPHERAYRVGVFLGGGIFVAVSALTVFVLTNPYLHVDPWNRFRRILDVWDLVLEVRIADPKAFYAKAYPPGIRSLTELGRTFLVPRGAAAALLLLPLAGALFTWLPAGRRIAAENVRPFLWLLLLPAIVTVLFTGGRIAHVWIVWAGLLGGLIRLLARGAGSEIPAAARVTAVPLAAASLGALAMILRTTYITWSRYYVPLVPIAVLIAVWEIDGLRRWVSARAGSVAGALLVLAMLLGVAAAVTAYPHYALGKLAYLRRAGWTSLPGLCTAASAGALSVAVLWGWLGAALAARRGLD